MRFFDRRKPSKWHERVTTTVGDVRPAPTTLLDRASHLFPYAELQLITRDYLGSRKRSQVETDNLLLELIKDHPCKEVAFAACTEALSNGLAGQILNTTFNVDPDNLSGLASYLHAFVAAAQRESETASSAKDNQRFASVSAAVTCHFVNQDVTPRTVGALFTAWIINAPTDRLLLSRAKLLTVKVCQQLRSELRTFLDETAQGFVTRHNLDLAVEYRTVLSLLRIANHDLDSVASPVLSEWRAWAAWTPHVGRLQRWATVKSEDLFQVSHRTGTTGSPLARYLQRFRRQEACLSWTTTAMVRGERFRSRGWTDHCRLRGTTQWVLTIAAEHCTRRTPKGTREYYATSPYHWVEGSRLACS